MLRTCYSILTKGHLYNQVMNKNIMTVGFHILKIAIATIC